jgi:ATP-dependent 26S proteasome regulatory subunit
MLDNTTKDIVNLLKAQYPILYIETHEEDRAERLLQDISDELSLDFYSWSFPGGLWQGKDEVNVGEELDPLGVLQYVNERENNSLFMLKDYHAFMEDDQIKRALKNIKSTDDIYTPIVIIAPKLVLPIELEKKVTVLELTLPNKEEIAELIDGAIEQLSHFTDKENLPSEKQRDELIKASSGLTEQEIENILAKSWTEHQKLDVSVVLEEKKQTIKKSQILEYFNDLEEFSNVGGMEQLKHWLEKRGNAFSDEAKEFGLPQPKGVLLTGIPGCGKSLISKAVAGLWNMPLLKLDMGRIFSGLVGSSEENIRKALRVAEAVAPVVLFLDEIEKGLSGNQSSGKTDGGTSSRVFGYLLSWLQDKDAPVFVIATANDISKLPPELLRPGRFDERFFVDLPGEEEREEILKIHLEKRGRDPENFELEDVVKQSQGYSGAELEQSIVSAMYDVFTERPDGDIKTQDLVQAVDNTIPLSTTKGRELDRLRQWAKNNAIFASKSSEEKTKGSSANGVSDRSKKSGKRNRMSLLS